MLYVTTRSKSDTYTAYKALTQDYAPDGGMFVPFHLTQIARSDIEGKTFSECVALVINTFFSARLNSWDIDFCIGRTPVKLVSLVRKNIVAELWHNLGTDYDYLAKNLYSIVCQNDGTVCPHWWKIAVRISILFGIYAQCLQEGVLNDEKIFDIAIDAEDASALMSAWYARKMGLPIHTIICCCQENNPSWELIKHGTIAGPALAAASVAQRCCFEQLLSAALSNDAVTKLLTAFDTHKQFAVEPDEVSVLHNGLFPASISNARIAPVMSSVQRTDNYNIDAGCAFVYGGLQDYRAVTGESREAILLSERPNK